MLRSILLVKDALNDIELALYALKRCGIHNEVVVARDGDEALEYLLRSGRHTGRLEDDPGLVLLDLKLQIVDGLTVLRTIRTTPHLASVPVVVTASALETDVARTMELGMERYVVKPIELKTFVEQMCQLTAQFIRH